jgi:hypothetical protein
LHHHDDGRAVATVTVVDAVATVSADAAGAATAARPNATVADATITPILLDRAFIEPLLECERVNMSCCFSSDAVCALPAFPGEVSNVFGTGEGIPWWTAERCISPFLRVHPGGRQSLTGGWCPQTTPRRPAG